MIASHQFIWDAKGAQIVGSQSMALGRSGKEFGRVFPNRFGLSQIPQRDNCFVIVVLTVLEYVAKVLATRIVVVHALARIHVQVSENADQVLMVIAVLGGLQSR